MDNDDDIVKDEGFDQTFTEAHRASFKDERGGAKSLSNDETSINENLSLSPYHPLDGLENDVVITTVEDLQKDLLHLQMENTVLHHFLEKNDPMGLELMETNLKQAQMAHEKSVISSRRSSTSKLHGRGSKSSETSGGTVTSSSLSANVVSTHAHEVPKINLTQRTDLILREMDDIQAELNSRYKRAHDIKLNLSAKIEEMETRKSELENSIENLEKFKQSSEIITIEKFIRFMEEWSKKSRLTVDKIRLRYSSLRVQFQKISTVLAEKLLIGENLQEIDFEQLRIENLHLVEKTEKLALLLLELKRMTGAGNLKLSQHKELLQMKIYEKEKIGTAITKKEKDIVKSDEEILKLYVELDEVKHEFYRIKSKISTYEGPDVMDYIKSKANLDTLRRELKMWTRRKTLKDMALTTAINEMKRLLGGKQPDPSWFE